MDRPEQGEFKRGRSRLVIWLAAALVVELAVVAALALNVSVLRGKLRQALTDFQQREQQLDAVAKRLGASASLSLGVAQPKSLDNVAVWTEPTFSFSLGNTALSSAAAAANAGRATTPWTRAPAHVEKRRWFYIVIHHSATPTGSAEAFEVYHRSRGMSRGLAYHFVVDNGSQDTEDGAVEVGTRWINQQPGGHCRQETINEQGIGICLVGDFSKARPTEKQLETLARLVYDLQQQFGIAPENILGHGQVLGEFSECPGDHFPWEKFRASLRQVADADRIESLRAAAAAFSSSLRVPPLNP